MKKIRYCLSALALLLAAGASAKEFETFDGQFYNGQFYPLIDIIEWGEQDKELPHLEFHVHQKEKPLDLAVVSGEKGGRPVLWIMYDLAYRGEKICRHVLAPAHFKEGQKLHLYRDNSDPDYDNIHVYSQPLQQKGKKKQLPDYVMKSYERCADEHASNMPFKPGEKAPGQPAAAAPAPRDLASESAPAPKAKLPAVPGKGIPPDYDNSAVPFSF